MTATGPVITAWAAVSPFGMDRKNFLDGMAAGQPAASTTKPEDGVVPGEHGYVVPNFAIREILGRKGTRMMDRVAALTITAVGQIFDAGEPGNAPEGTGLVLGTTTGSIWGAMDFTRTSMLAELPYHVEPGRMPGGVMNCAAGHCAIWYQLTGPNTTLANGRPSGLIALRYVRRLLARGRTNTALVGSVEEYSLDRSWLEYNGRDGAPGPLGEGACLFLLENPGSVSPDRTPLAELCSVSSRVYPEDDPRASMQACVLDALTEAGVDAADVSIVAPSGFTGEAGEYESEVLDGLFGRARPQWVDVAGLIGDTGAVSSSFQVAAALGLAGDRPGVAVVTSVDADGTIACAVFRLFGVQT